MYGLLWILLAVKIACWTAGGASAGAAALPSGSSCATVPGTVMSAGPGAGAAGAGGGGGRGRGRGGGGSRGGRRGRRRREGGAARAVLRQRGAGQDQY